MQDESARGCTIAKGGHVENAEATPALRSFDRGADGISDDGAIEPASAAAGLTDDGGYRAAITAVRGHQDFLRRFEIRATSEVPDTFHRAHQSDYKHNNKSRMRQAEADPSAVAGTAEEAAGGVVIHQALLLWQTSSNNYLSHNYLSHNYLTARADHRRCHRPSAQGMLAPACLRPHARPCHACPCHAMPLAAWVVCKIVPHAEFGHRVRVCVRACARARVYLCVGVRSCA